MGDTGVANATKTTDVIMYSTRYVGRIKVREWFFLDELSTFWKVLFT